MWLKSKKSCNVLGIAILTVLVLYTLSLFVPLVWSMLTAFKGNLDYLENPLWFPQTWKTENILKTFDNFFVSVNRSGDIVTIFIEEMLLNSLLYAIGGAFFSALTCCVTAYATARFSFRFSRIIFGVVIVTMTLPIVGNLPSELQLLKALRLYDSIIGMWICKANFLGMYYLVFFGFFRGMPKDFTEAAKIDGASNFSILLLIAMPLVRSTFLTIMLINFVGLWNDYTVTISYMPSIPTLAYGLYDYSFSPRPEINNTPMRLMGCFILIVPVLVVFLAFHKRLMGNISMGGVKE